MRRRTLSFFALTAVVAMSVVPVMASDITVKRADWIGGAEGFLPLAPSGDGVLRPLAVENAVIRAAELANPGMIAQLYMKTLTQWVSDGRVTLHQDGTIAFGDQDAYDALNAEWRAGLVRELRAYLVNVKASLTDDQIVELTTAKFVDGATLVVPRLSKSWYQPPVSPLADGDINEVTVCMSCPDPDGSAICEGGCVVDCSPPSQDCAHVTVPWPWPWPGGSGTPIGGAYAPFELQRRR